MKKITIIPLTVLFLTVQIVGISCSDKQGSANVARTDSTSITASENLPVKVSSSNGNLDFVTASNFAIPAVVHIKTTYYKASAATANTFGQQYGAPLRRGAPIMGLGSGVTISADGYIATKNHVVANASEIEVIFPDRRSFPAKLVGRDPNTDLALLKVDASDLPIVKFGNSDIVQVGQWVLAVGYPLSLNSTVTAGIISAKGRSIGIINRPSRNRFGSDQEPSGNAAIESFLQTDAAINPGNSGGALVNTDGELIGINTAISSQTGSFAGYAFAIPVSLVQKILDDLKNYGSVVRGVLGVSFPSPVAEDQFLKEQGIDPGSVHGVYVMGVQDESAASLAGLKEGDIIQSIDGVKLFSSTEFSERIARHKPGDSIKLGYLRNGNTDIASAILKAEEPPKVETKNAESLIEIYKRLGATFAPLTGAWKQRFNINSGVVVTDVRTGGFFDQIGIPSTRQGIFINSGQDIQVLTLMLTILKNVDDL